jgi:hypothetical protein
MLLKAVHRGHQLLHGGIYSIILYTFLICLKYFIIQKILLNTFTVYTESCFTIEHVFGFHLHCLFTEQPCMYETVGHQLLMPGDTSNTRLRDDDGIL